MMMKIVRLLFIISALKYNQMLGQNIERKNNTVYGEFFGNAQSLLSVNYEKLINLKNNEYFTFGIRVGAGIARTRFDHKIAYNIPIEFNTIIGRNKNNLEIGVGYTQIIATSNLNDTIIPKVYKRNFDYALFFRLGYRLINEKNLVFRVAPLIMFVHDPPLDNTLKLQYTIGLSLGYCFNLKK